MESLLSQVVEVSMACNVRERATVIPIISRATNAMVKRCHIKPSLEEKIIFEIEEKIKSSDREEIVIHNSDRKYLKDDVISMLVKLIKDGTFAPPVHLLLDSSYYDICAQLSDLDGVAICKHIDENFARLHPDIPYDKLRLIIMCSECGDSNGDEGEYDIPIHTLISMYMPKRVQYVCSYKYRYDDHEDIRHIAFTDRLKIQYATNREIYVVKGNEDIVCPELDIALIDGANYADDAIISDDGGQHHWQKSIIELMSADCCTFGNIIVVNQRALDCNANHVIGKCIDQSRKPLRVLVDGKPGNLRQFGLLVYRAMQCGKVARYDHIPFERIKIFADFITKDPLTLNRVDMAIIMGETISTTRDNAPTMSAGEIYMALEALASALYEAFDPRNTGDYDPYMNEHYDNDDNSYHEYHEYEEDDEEDEYDDEEDED